MSDETMGEKFKRLQEAAKSPSGHVEYAANAKALIDLINDPAFAEYILGLERDKRERVEHFADVRRIAEWIAARGGALQDPALAFTEGPERYLATMTYHVSDALERCTEANEQLESQLTTANQAREAAEKRVRELEGEVETWKRRAPNAFTAEMFVCGVEFQQVVALAESGWRGSRPIHRENESRFRMALGKKGIPCETKPIDGYGDTWSELTVKDTP